MSNLKVTVKDIKELMEQMEKNGLGCIEIEDGELKLKIKAKENNVVLNQSTPVQTSQISVESPIASVTENATQIENTQAKAQGNEVKAPIVGTFYSAPSPDKDDFVKVGDKVKKGDTLFIIESMKLMNEVQSEFDGEVVDICVKNGNAVEFDQTIMIIR